MLAIALVGCSPNTTADNPENSESSDRPQVVVSHNVLCEFTQTIAADTIDLTCLVEGGQDPHTYSAVPSDRQAIETADLVLHGGYELTPGILGIIEAANLDAPVVAVYERAVPNPISGEGHAHGEEEHAHEDEKTAAEGEEHGHEEHAHEGEKVAAEGEEHGHESDPHVWHDVENAIAAVEIIQTQLSELEPQNATNYRQNAAELQTELENLDTWVEAQIATIPPGVRTLITTHDAFNYYVEAYGLEKSEALQGLSSEEAPTASRVKALVNTITATGVPTIFPEVTANDETIAALAREAKVQVWETELIADGVGEPGSDTATYRQMIEHNTCAIALGLGGQCQPNP